MCCLFTFDLMLYYGSSLLQFLNILCVELYATVAVYNDLLLLGRVALEAQQPIVIRLSRGRSVGPYVHVSVCLSVCLVHCGKTADRIRMPFGIVGRTGSGMRQVVGFGDRSTGRGSFGGEFGAHRCNQWGLYGVCVRQCHDAALFPNYFGQTC